MMHCPQNKGDMCKIEENSKMVFYLKQSRDNNDEIVIKYPEVFNKMTENLFGSSLK